MATPIPEAPTITAETPASSIVIAAWEVPGGQDHDKLRDDLLVMMPLFTKLLVSFAKDDAPSVKALLPTFECRSRWRWMLDVLSEQAAEEAESQKIAPVASPDAQHAIAPSTEQQS